MRIAFVGKGGSGKSTLSASFVSFITQNTEKNIMVVDADLNIHIPELLGMKKIDSINHLSNETTSKEIKTWLLGKNEMPHMGAFRKTTPPTRKSNIIKIEDLEKTPLKSYCNHSKNLYVFAVGTYQEEEIGSVCYHASLANFETILNHLDDKNGYLVADMVAGVDAFAGTLHAQFDLTILIVEPTKRSIEVYERYKKLSEEAKVYDSVFVIGNKIRNQEEKEFLKKHIDEEKIIGFFEDDEHIREIDRTEEKLDINKLNKANKVILKNGSRLAN